MNELIKDYLIRERNWIILLMKIIFLILLPYLVLSTIHPEGNLDFVRYCKYFNYPVEEHTI